MAKRILVVEDYEPTRALYSEELTEAGYEVLTAENGFEALKTFEREDLDLVVTDIRMPGMSGVTLIHCLKAHEKSVPIIVVSAYPQYEGPLEGNIRAFFAKPVNLELLKRSVSEVIG